MIQRDLPQFNPWFGVLSSAVGRRSAQDRSQAMTDASRRKERDVAQRDVDRLRSSIQALTRNVNPLGKILDFLQEDVEAMQKELVVWRHESQDNVQALQREHKSVTHTHTHT